jgi:hypothetical protein
VDQVRQLSGLYFQNIIGIYLYRITVTNYQESQQTEKETMFKGSNKKSSIEGVLELDASTLALVSGGAGEARIEDAVVFKHLDDLLNARLNNLSEITYSVPVPRPDVIVDQFPAGFDLRAFA